MSMRLFFLFAMFKKDKVLMKGFYQKKSKVSLILSYLTKKMRLNLKYRLNSQCKNANTTLNRVEKVPKGRKFCLFSIFVVRLKTALLYWKIDLQVVDIHRHPNISNECFQSTKMRDASHASDHKQEYPFHHPWVVNGAALSEGQCPLPVFLK